MDDDKPFKPQNLTLESLGVRSVGAGADLSTSAKVGIDLQTGKGYSLSSGVEGKATLTARIIDNGGEDNLYNTNSSLSAEQSNSIGLTTKSLLGAVGIKLKEEAYGYFNFSNGTDASVAGTTQQEKQINFKLLALKIHHTKSSSGNWDFKIGLTTDAGIELKTTDRTRTVTSSATSQSGSNN